MSKVLRQAGLWETQGRIQSEENDRGNRLGPDRSDVDLVDGSWIRHQDCGSYSACLMVVALGSWASESFTCRGCRKLTVVAEKEWITFSLGHAKKVGVLDEC